MAQGFGWGHRYTYAALGATFLIAAAAIARVGRQSPRLRNAALAMVLVGIAVVVPLRLVQSSRFIADRLYLVTFEQIDPLFVISLTDPKFPKILGELKIPGYSTYLHPYDSDRLIGLGYDTKVNQW